MRELTFVLVVKYDSRERKENFEILLRYISSNFPDSPVLIIKNNCDPFYRTQYINTLLRACQTKFAIVQDVDVILNPKQIKSAIVLAENSPLVYPYTLPWCVVTGVKKDLAYNDLERLKIELTDKQITVSVGGAYVVNVAEYLACGGENERFIDWGPEDRERFMRVKILTGCDPKRVEGPIFHLFHPYSDKKTWSQMYFRANDTEFRRICGKSAQELKREVEGWPWIKGRVVNTAPMGQTPEVRPIQHIITRLGIEDDNKSGRLGNKLFQAAACIGYAEKYGYKAVMPPWKLKNIFKNIPTQDLFPARIRIIKEPYFQFKLIEQQSLGDITLDGYFQSEKYFEHCADKIRREYYKPDEATADYADKVYSALSQNGRLRITVVQVRRDDYLKKSNYHTVQPIEYYVKGINLLKDKTDKFVVFCDKTAESWCNSEFEKLGINFELAPQDNYIGDIFVMSKCQNYIIANSTFGWWGAWLNPNQDSITVIAPRNWFGPAANINDADLVPERWVRI